MYVEARGRSGQYRFVTQICPAGGLGALEAPQRGPGQSPGIKRIFGNNLLKIGGKSGI